ncbi:MAG: anthranilate synthase component I family protein [Candidatus Omnitrophica bacterium]|nr:anthranilate synthase component I family protein [Candidatus Omnitrophota bacterium]
MLWFGMQRVILVDHLQQRSWLLSIVDPHSPQPVAQREALEALHRLAAQIDEADAPSRVGTSSPPRAERGAPGSVGRSLPPAAALPSPPRAERGAPGSVGRSLPPAAALPSPPRAERGAPGSVAGDIALEPTMTRAQYEAMAAQALEFIRDGEVFQANLAQRFTARWDGEPLALYRALRRINPSPFACYLACGELAVVSCSPERLVRVQEGRVDTRPIAGTRPRGATPQEDAFNSLELLLSEKERAEHIMLVDLERNDLGRVCEAGSVSVDELMALEEYSHVIHIVSNISGRLTRGLGAADIIRAVFPGGTITGCPKVRCMEIIRELEPVARGLYSGSLGCLGFDRSMDLNIAIRTIIIQGHALSFHVGAGIVADSVPEREYCETLDKARALTHAVQAMRASTEDLHAAVG